MATLALTAAGAALGGAVLPAGISVLGATLSGATIGSQIGALAGGYIDQALFGASGQARATSGPRLSDLKITTSTEGAAIPRLFGWSRLGGQVIWATDLEEESVTTVTGSSGSSKGMPSGSAAKRTDYRYYANFAVALCEGEITDIGRVWADGQEIDLGEHVWRLYYGTETQPPDGLIVAHEGADAAPAYRGVAYIVFEHMALEAFGNRIPQLSFEVFRSVDPFAKLVRGVVMIPGSGEFVYATDPVTRTLSRVSTEPENRHTLRGGTDWQVALDQLGRLLPNARSTSLVVSWFGNDLRAGACLVRPCVDSRDKTSEPLVWSVAGLDRASAPLVSTVDGKPAYGGTPSDSTVVAAIRDLKARGHKVVLNPFILMDIPADNALDDPYTGASQQPAYPWRGRITVDPAPGRAGSPDKSAGAATQIAKLVGTATSEHFAVSGDAVGYSGPAEWTFRRMVLHYAHLALAAGGVDGFLIGSEMRGLTQVRAGSETYPFVSALVTLAADVKAILGASTKVSYAADWSEYFGHQPADGSGDVHFHLDPLWASPAIDAIAIDCYWPLADWRDGDHLDRSAGARSVYDVDYLKSNLAAGEGYDWFYATPADRDAQLRTPITDGVADKPWVYRYKDVRSWWQNKHYDRAGGVESSSPTAWVPQSKPIWLTEIGCPAIDKGANQPNVFVDPKSSESFVPYHSSGERDDLMQHRYLRAVLEAFDPAHAGYLPNANPVSSVYGGRMIDLDNIHLYAWDARPYPAFPQNGAVWSDGENWRLGHWLTGRIAKQDLGAVIAALLEDYAFRDIDVSAVDGLVAGLVIERAMSAREALQPLELAYFLDAVESGDVVRFMHRGAEPPRVVLNLDDLVETKAGADLVQLTRAQETDLPAEARLSYAALESDYRQAVARSRRLVGAAGRISEAQLALVMDADQAIRTADTWLFETWAARERARFVLPPSALVLQPGDVVTLERGEQSRLFRITDVGEHGARDIDAIGVDPTVYAGGGGVVRPVPPSEGDKIGPILTTFLDLPLLASNAAEVTGYVAMAREPWPAGGAALYRSAEDANFTLASIVTRRATTGITLDPIEPGFEARVDRGRRIRVKLDTGMLVSTTPLNLLAGANAAAIEGTDGEWDVLQFQTASLIAPQIYELSSLLRGQAGTEHVMRAMIPAGARFVVLDGAVASVPLTLGDIGLPLSWRYGPAQRALGDASYRTMSQAFRGIGLRPLSPVHVRGSRSTGDLNITWIRRTRLGGDSWEAVEVPLAEASEAYEIDVLSGGTVVRTLSSIAPAVLYSADDQVTDFGTLPFSVTVRVYQISAVFGRGAPRQAII
ncbi:MAG: glycoside hydrolase/phage tail family protein [Hyphomicrobiaceae bacterium]